jgi:dTDP-4-amino-4,6-dideoxygalactose transaminase
MAVPLFDTSAALGPLRDELRAAVDRVLDSQRYILGPEVSAFEQEFAAYCGAGYAIGVANGTDAITIALRAMGVGPGDEVVVPSFTFYASAEAIPATGATPVFCDIDPDTYCVTPESVRAVLTPRTKAVIAVHLFGNVAPVAEIEALGVPVLEDAAQAAGSTSAEGRAGSLGAAATFSFFPAKVTYEQVGYNSRLDELQAAILRVQLPHLDSWADGRRRAGLHYEEAGLGDFVKLPRPVAGSSPAWHLYVVAADDVADVEDALASAAIEHRGYYRTPVHRQAAMRRWGAGVELPFTEEAARTHIAIPMSPVLSRAQAGEVAGAVAGA